VAQRKGGGTMKKPFNMLNDLEEDKLYGTVEIKFENSVVTIIRFIENIKPTDNGLSYRNDRGNCNGRS
jgi:hypothetical protein